MTGTREVLTSENVRYMLEQRVTEAGGVRALARTSGIAKDSISMAIKPGGPIRPAIIELLGLQKNEETYVHKAK